MWVPSCRCEPANLPLCDWKSRAVLNFLVNNISYCWSRNSHDSSNESSSRRMLVVKCLKQGYFHKRLRNEGQFFLSVQKTINTYRFFITIHYYSIKTWCVKLISTSIDAHFNLLHVNCWYWYYWHWSFARKIQF